MTKRYKLLKQMPGHEPGTIFIKEEDGDFVEEDNGSSWAYANELLKALTDPDCSLDMTEWLEPIEPEQPRWEVSKPFSFLKDFDFSIHINLNCSDETAEKVHDLVEAVMIFVHTKPGADPDLQGDLYHYAIPVREALHKERGGDNG